MTANPFATALQRLSVVRAENDLLFDRTGQRFIDLLSGGGTVFLGHCNPAVVDATARQLRELWICSTLPTPPREEARTLIESYFPPTHALACLYSTGMEAAEFALRIARVSTGRRGVIGFRHCMHGKSSATASLGWPNDLVRLPDFHSLPYLADRTEDEILESVADCLAAEPIGCVLLEPIAGSAGGYRTTPSLARGLSRLCSEHGTLLVCDEIFTGFHRTGPALLHQQLGIEPDIVLVGKTLGNGFPVSAVMADRRHEIVPAMLPNSTYSGNALASAAIVSTLGEMRRLDLPTMVKKLADVITEVLGPLGSMGVPLRGQGALHILELPSPAVASLVGARLLELGVVASIAGPFVRVLPAATITLDHLTQACEAVHEACTEVLSTTSRT